MPAPLGADRHARRARSAQGREHAPGEQQPEPAHRQSADDEDAPTHHHATPPRIPQAADAAAGVLPVQPSEPGRAAPADLPARGAAARSCCTSSSLIWLKSRYQ